MDSGTRWGGERSFWRCRRRGVGSGVAINYVVASCHSVTVAPRQHDLIAVTLYAKHIYRRPVRGKGGFFARVFSPQAKRCAVNTSGEKLSSPQTTEKRYALRADARANHPNTLYSNVEKNRSICPMKIASMNMTDVHKVSPSQAREAVATIMRLWRLAQRLALSAPDGHGHGIDGKQGPPADNDSPEGPETRPGGRGQQGDPHDLR